MPKKLQVADLLLKPMLNSYGPNSQALTSNEEAFNKLVSSCKDAILLLNLPAENSQLVKQLLLRVYLQGGIDTIQNLGSPQPSPEPMPPRKGPTHLTGIRIPKDC